MIKNRWKTAFWICLFTLLIVIVVGFYMIVEINLDRASTNENDRMISYDLDEIVTIINETDLTKKQIQKALGYENELPDTITLNRAKLIFKNDKLFKISNP